MKRNIYTAISLISLLLVFSCTNEKIQVDREMVKYTVTYSVSTQDVYDAFGQTSWIRDNRLRDETDCVGVMTFVYDSKGALIDSKITTSKNINLVQQSFENIEKGDYTFVTVETLLNTATNKSDCWSLDGTGTLSTLKITQTQRPLRHNIVGVCSQNISVTGNVSVNVAPKAIGSMINFHCYHFEDTEYVNLGFGTRDILDYYSLDPQLQRKDRFIAKLSDKDSFYLRASMLATESSANYVTFYLLESNIGWMNGYQDESIYNQTGWLNYKERSADLEDGQVYEAGFYYQIDGSTASFLGNQDGLKEFIASCEDYDKNVEKQKHVFREPYISWGASVASVKEFMSGYEVGNNGNLIANDNGLFTLWYYGRYKEQEIQYYFTSETGGLKEAVLFFDSEKIGEDEILKVFNDLGYQFALSEDGNYLYTTNDGKSYVFLGLNTQNYWVVDYFSSESTTRSAFNLKDLRNRYVK